MVPCLPTILTVATATACISALTRAITGKERDERVRCKRLTIKVAGNAQDSKTQFTAHPLPLSASEADNVLLDNGQFQQTSVIGIDCEWQPERGRSHNRVSLLQLAPAADVCFLAQLLHMDKVPEQIPYVLQDPLIIKVGIGVREDVRRLALDYNITCRSVVDLVDVINLTQPSLLLGGSSLAAVSKTLLGLEVDKSHQCSDWGNQHLSLQQLEYAAVDAWLGLRLAEQLHTLLLSQQQQQQHGLEAAAGGGGAADFESVPADLEVFLSKYVVSTAAAKASKQQQQQQCVVGSVASRQQLGAGPCLPQRKQQQQQQQQPKATSNSHVQLQWQRWKQLDQQQQIQLLLQLHLLLQHARLISNPAPWQQQQQQQQRGRGRNRNKQAKSAQQQQREWQQQQDRRQRQLEQLQRLGQQAAAPTRSIFDKLQNLKPARLPTRKSLQYENCRIIGPDGKALATCGAKKVKWYLDRDLAEVVEDIPTIAIRLKFKPRGSGHADDQYYLSDKDNRCVVCGHEGEYLRHSIVPHCYRQHFPADMKSHLSHDIVLLCVGCHQICNILDQKRMQELGVQYGAPLEDESRRFRTDRQLAQVRSAGKALANPAASKIPAARVQHLRTIIMQHFGASEWHESLMSAANELEPKREEEGWASHGSVVVAAVMAAGQQQQQQQQHEGVSNAVDGAAGFNSNASQQQQQQQQHQGVRNASAAANNAARSDDNASQQQQQQGLRDADKCASKLGSCASQQQQQPQQERQATADALQAANKPRQQSSAAAAAAAADGTSHVYVAAPKEVDIDSMIDTLLEDALLEVEAAAEAGADCHDVKVHSISDITTIALAGTGAFMALAAAAAAAVAAGGDKRLLQAATRALTAFSSSSSSSRYHAVPDSNGSSTCCIDRNNHSDTFICRTSGSRGSSVLKYGVYVCLAAVAAAAMVCGADLCPSGSSNGSSSSSHMSTDHTPTLKSANATAASRASSSSSRCGTAVRPTAPAAPAAASVDTAAAAAAAEAALGEFIKAWRRHFLAVMQPKHLPPFWSVEARVRNSSGTDMPAPGLRDQHTSSQIMATA